MKIMQRQSRACQRCRARKSKCDLGSPNAPNLPPCQRCLRDHVECILATSNRGGLRVRKSTVASVVTNDRQSISMSSDALDSQPYRDLPASFSQPGAVGQQEFQQHESLLSPDIEDTIAATDLHATSDALNLLSQAAELGTYATPGRLSQGTGATPGASSTTTSIPREHDSRRHDAGSNVINHGSLQYPLVLKGLLTTLQVSQLLNRFRQFYHPYLPIAPRRCFDADSLPFLASQEPHLLTAMITVAARDLPQGERILSACSNHMNQLVAELSAGKKCDVEAVEALLLLAEWEPQDSLSEAKKVGCGEEDRAAWMHVGLALRVGYFLGLDRTAIKHDDEEKATHLNRRRVAWAACYVTDRQLSARIGRAFWSRGPGPLVGVGRHGRQTFDDFPSLQPQNAEEDDYASILQATLDITQLFSNVHDILYSGMGGSMKLMLAGNYVKYVDDFRSAIVGWKSVWGTLTCSPNLKASMQMSYEYLRLYTNAYAFQATTSRTAASKTQNSLGLLEIPIESVASMPDARFIYESVDAAKSLLSIITSYIDAETCLRYLPLRFALYCVNSAVFLYKAWSFEVLSTAEKLGIRQMIKDVILRLQKASVRPNDFASRYSQLLELLWQRKDVANPSSTSVAMPDASFVTTPSRPAALFNQQDEFSWLDLQAVGELVSGDQDAGHSNMGGDGFSNFMGMPGDWSDVGWLDGDDVNRFF